MSITAKIREGRGPFWGRAKRLAKYCLSVHMPAGGVLKPLFRCAYRIHVGCRELIAWFLRFFWYEPLFRSQCDAVGCGLRMEQLPYLQGNGSIRLGEMVELSGKPSFGFGNSAHDRPVLSIGDRTFIGHNVSIVCGDQIVIGSDCLIAGGVSMRDYDGHPIDAAERRKNRRVRADEIHPIRIANDVWIGRAATILKGVSIGDRSIVAAGAVVTKDVPPDSIVAGNPARIIRQGIPEGDATPQESDPT